MRKRKEEKIKTAYIIFSGRQQNIGIPIYEFKTITADIPGDKYFLIDTEQSWYSTIHIPDLSKYSRTIFIGNSMGGFAAILYGTLFNATKILAFSPQTFIDTNNRTKYQDNRWNPPTNHPYPDLKQIPKHNNITIYYDKNHVLDRIHAERLTHANLIHYPGKHAVVKQLKLDNKLKDILCLKE